MRFRRLCLRGILAAGALVAAVLILAFLPFVQTWAARMLLASRPDLHGSLGSLSAGWNRTFLSDLHVERRGAVLTIPSLEADVPLVSAAVGRRIFVRRLVAKGWTLDLTHSFPAAVTAPTAARKRPVPGGFLPEAFAGEASPEEQTVRAFRGIFSSLVLPVDAALDGVDLEGTILLREGDGRPAGRVAIILTGGGLAAGREGAFDFVLTLKFPDAAARVGSISAHGVLRTEMSTPRTFTRLEAKVDATAEGGQLARKVGLSGDVAAARGPDGESYTLTLVRGPDRLASLEARFPDATRRLAGHWQLDLRDSDLVPFTLGRPLPAFTATGEGRFDADNAFSAVHAWGALRISAARLGVVVPEWDAAGAVTLAADFDLAHRGDSLRVDRLTASLAGAGPVAEVRALQAFEFNGRTGELKVADPSGDLVGISIQGFPLAWLRRYASGFGITGGDLHGEFVVGAGNGGLAVRPRSPLTADGVAVAWGGRPLAEAVDVSVHVLADYAPTGWQVQVAPLTLSSAGMKILALDARVGKLAGRGQTLKAAGSWNVALPALLRQPAANAVTAAITGSAEGSFSANFGRVRELQVKTEIIADGLPRITADISTETAADGRIAFSMPLRLERDGRVSDMAASGTWTRTKDGPRFDLQLASDRLAFDDLKLLGAALGARAPAPAEGEADPAAEADRRVAAPPWKGVSGRITLALRRVSAPQVDVRDVAASVRIDSSGVSVRGGRATVGDGCGIRIDGGLEFAGGVSRPYGLDGTVGVSNLDSAKLLEALDPGQPPPLDGKFDIAAHVTSRGADLGDVLDRIQGEFHLASRGGLFRALRTDVTESIKQTPSRLSGAIGTVTSLFGLKGDAADAAGKFIDKSGQAVVDLTNRVAEIRYDQINATATRGADLDIRLTNFALIAPEERLTGTGEIAYREGVPVVAQPLSLDLQLNMQGQAAALAGSVGLLKDEKDDLGYTKLAQPIHLGGTLAKVDQTQFREMLIQAALRKAAGSLLDKLLGK